jgi:dGTPase
VAKAEEGKAKRVVGEMYGYFAENPCELPPEYRVIAETQDIHRAVCDYISGMSDRYCVSMYEKLFVPQPWSL